LKVEARISLAYQDEMKAKAIKEAISPDNTSMPKGLSIETFVEENRVVTVIKYSGDNFLTLQSTIDDLLSCVSVAEKSISALKARGKNFLDTKSDDEQKDFLGSFLKS